MYHTFIFWMQLENAFFLYIFVIPVLIAVYIRIISVENEKIIINSHIVS